MSTVGQFERITQNRVVKLFRRTLGYDYLGNWTDRIGNANIEPELLGDWLKKRGLDEEIISRALHTFTKDAGDTSKGLYDRNKNVYEMLRYGVQVKRGAGENTETVWLIDWKQPENNHFAIAEEVTVAASNPKAYEKRPDIVLYVNGIALGILELKRSTVNVGTGIRQNRENQEKEFIEPFFSTMQWLMAGNDTEGLRYGSIQAAQKYYLTWKEPSSIENPLDRALAQMCDKSRFLELIHDFIVFDGGTKKLCRHNQYFGVRAAQDHVRRREGGIIWHTQGSGKSLIMVWLAKWIRENMPDSRVLIVTDRTELDEQIEKVFKGVKENIYRTRSGADLIARLNDTTPWLLCSLIHKFAGKEKGPKSNEATAAAFVAEVKRALSADFKPKGDIYVFVDECHRTQSGDEEGFHASMKRLLPNAMFIGFTGTPLLKTDKRKSVETFGGYIHTYKYDEAVRDGVVLDLRYEARDIEQSLTSPARVDEWFELKTRGLTDLAKAQLKRRWGTMQKVLSSQSRLEKIVGDILLDMERHERFLSGRGNAMLITGSIYEACKIYDIFFKTHLKGKCAVVTSYRPTAASIKGEEAGEGDTEKLEEYDIYQRMLADWFNEPPEVAVTRTEEFERAVKKKFVEEPGQMQLLIVVDKLLTGFDAPPATYLYIDAAMRDHGLFQAICRVNRLDGNDKDYGYIIDYKHLFKGLEGAVKDYTSGALDGYDKEDVEGLLKDRLEKGRELLELRLETVRALCELVDPPRDSVAYLRYFVARDSGDAAQSKANEPKRLALYTHVAALIRAFTASANELTASGYTDAEIAKLRADVNHYEKVRTEVKIGSKDLVDLKQFEPAMRQLVDRYIRAEESETLSAFDDLSLIELIVERGVGALEALPKGLRENKDAAAETVENNVRRLIVDEYPINPKYYEKMSELLDALIKQRKQGAIDYHKYLDEMVDLTRKAKNAGTDGVYPKSLDTRARRSLYDNLDKDETLALQVDEAVRKSRQDEWRGHPVKLRKVKLAIQTALGDDEARADKLFELVKNQPDY
jgi:type I restriction enzyme R subunit